MNELGERAKLTAEIARLGQQLSLAKRLLAAAGMSPTLIEASLVDPYEAKILFQGSAVQDHAYTVRDTMRLAEHLAAIEEGE